MGALTLTLTLVGSFVAPSHQDAVLRGRQKVLSTYCHRRDLQSEVGLELWSRYFLQRAISVMSNPSSSPNPNLRLMTEELYAGRLLPHTPLYDL